jgi:hypothetical protein
MSSYRIVWFVKIFQNEPVNYMIKTVEKENEESDYIPKDALLEPHHSNFILVDNSDLVRFGGEIDFRAKLEQQLQNYSKDPKKKAPLVLLVVGGGPNTYMTCLRTVQANSPCVFIKVRFARLFFTLGLFSMTISVYSKGIWRLCQYHVGKYIQLFLDLSKSRKLTIVFKIKVCLREN